MRGLVLVGCIGVSSAALLSACAQDAHPTQGFTTTQAALEGMEEALPYGSDAEGSSSGGEDPQGYPGGEDPQGYPGGSQGSPGGEGSYADAGEDLSGVIDGSVSPEGLDAYEDASDDAQDPSVGPGPGGPEPYVDVMNADVTDPSDPGGSGPGPGGPEPYVDVMSVDVEPEPDTDVEPDTDAEPDTDGPEPDTVWPEPDTVWPEPDTDGPEPDTVWPEPDTDDPEPDTVWPEPDTVWPEPDVDVEPDTVWPEPDTVWPEPDVDVEPDTDGPEPDITEEDLCEGVDCDDEDACTEDTCDPETGLCVHTFIDVPECNPCTLAPEPKKSDWSIPGIKVGVDVPGSGMWCKLFYLPGELQASVTFSGEGEASVDSSCKGHYTGGAQFSREMEFCGPLLAGATSFETELDMQHCEVCEDPPQFECAGYDCLEAKLSGSEHPQTGVNAVLELGDTSFIGGVKCNLGITQGWKFTGALEATIPGPEPCTEDVCHECYKASIDAQPTQTISAGCGGSIGGLSVSGGGSGTLQGSLKNTVRMGHPSCASPAHCVTGGIDGGFDLALNLGIGAGITGAITVAKYSCSWTWDKGTCADEEDTQPLTCKWKFFDLWPW